MCTCRPTGWATKSTVQRERADKETSHSYSLDNILGNMTRQHRNKMRSSVNYKMKCNCIRVAWLLCGEFHPYRKKGTWSESLRLFIRFNYLEMFCTQSYIVSISCEISLESKMYNGFFFCNVCIWQLKFINLCFVFFTKWCQYCEHFYNVWTPVNPYLCLLCLWTVRKV